eukprot:gene49193-66795_t
METLPREEIRRRVGTADAMMAFMPDWVDADFLAACPPMTFDVAACTARGIWLSIVPDLLTVPTAELAIGLTIGLTRKMIQADARVRCGKFAGWRPEFFGLGIAGSAIGILGMGAIGQAIAERLNGWGATLLYNDRVPIPAPGGEARPSVARRSLEEVLSESDIVILALAL